MSDTVPVSQAELGETDRSMFADIMGHEPDDASTQEQGRQSEQQHEGEEPDGEHEDEGHRDEGDQGRDERGRFAARQEQGKDEPAKGDQPTKGETPAERGLRGELRTTRDRAQAAEGKLAELNASIEDRVKAAVQEAMRSVQPQQAAPQAQQPASPAVDEDPAPDMFLDPQGFANWQGRQFDRRLEAANRQNEARRVEWSLQAAAGRHGDEFRQAHAAAEQGANDPVIRAAMTRVLASADPGEALMQWHRQQRVQQEIGNDPNAYRARLEQEQRDKLMNDPEFRKQVLEALQQEARTGNNGGPRITTQMPPSLNGARGSGGQRPQPGDDDTSERGIFRHALG